MKWTSKQVEEIASIKNYDGWQIYDRYGILISGVSSAMLVNALTACLTSGFSIDHYTRSFSGALLRIYIE